MLMQCTIQMAHISISLNGLPCVSIGQVNFNQATTFSCKNGVTEIALLILNILSMYKRTATNKNNNILFKIIYYFFFKNKINIIQVWTSTKQIKASTKVVRLRLQKKKSSDLNSFRFSFFIFLLVQSEHWKFQWKLDDSFSVIIM